MGKGRFYSSHIPENHQYPVDAIEEIKRVEGRKANQLKEVLEQSHGRKVGGNVTIYNNIDTKILHNLGYNPEDDLIARIDNPHTEEEEEPVEILVVKKNYFDEQAARVKDISKIFDYEDNLQEKYTRKRK